MALDPGWLEMQDMETLVEVKRRLVQQLDVAEANMNEKERLFKEALDECDQVYDYIAKRIRDDLNDGETQANG